MPIHLSCLDYSRPTIIKTYFKVDSLQALFSYDIAEKEKASIVLAHKVFIKEQRQRKSTSSSGDIMARYTQLIQHALSSWQHQLTEMRLRC